MTNGSDPPHNLVLAGFMGTGKSVGGAGVAERLGRQLNRQRQMLWALSHDLRTPITAIRRCASALI